MPTFAYTARDSSGESVKGTLSGATAEEISRMLRADGKYPTDVRVAGSAETTPKAGRSSRGIRIPRADVLQISQQLAIMLETGVTLPDALDCIAAQAVHPKTKLLTAELTNLVKQGVDFSAALARHPASFPKLFLALVKASEKSGKMPELLGRAATYLRDEADIRRRVKGALTYPGIMFCFAIVVTTFLLIFVLPRFTAIYASKKAALPLPTKLLMNASDTLVGGWWWIVPTLSILIVAAVKYLRTDKGSRQWHWAQLRLPLLGPLFRQVHLSRGLRMMGTMGSAGVVLSECVDVTADVTDNSYFRDLWKDVGEQLQVGRQLSEPLAKSGLVPANVAQMIKSGEKGGKLSQVMEQLAGFSEAELKDKIVEMTRYIEPAMIIGMGALIGSVALALLLPIFTISKVMASG